MVKFRINKWLCKDDKTFKIHNNTIVTGSVKDMWHLEHIINKINKNGKKKASRRIPA